MKINTKEDLKNEILIRMRQHLGTEEYLLLENILRETFYDIEIVVPDIEIPETINSMNKKILSLYELKRGASLSKHTMKEYMITANDFTKRICENKSLTQVTTEDIEHYLRIKRNNSNCNTSLNNKRRKLNSLFKWMQKNGMITSNPIDNVECFKESTKPIDYLTAVEVEQLKSGCVDRRDRALLEWLRCTAVRRGEIPYVNINQIDWRTGKVLIYGEKTSTYRTVMLDDVALKYISEYIIKERNLSLNSCENLFTYCRGDKSRPLGKAGVYAEIKRIAERSELPKNRRVYPHLFRKTTATNIVKRGGTIEDAGYYLGHKPEGVTARHYAFMGEEHTAKIFKKCIEAY